MNKQDKEYIDEHYPTAQNVADMIGKGVAEHNKRTMQAKAYRDFIVSQGRQDKPKDAVIHAEAVSSPSAKKG